MTYLIDAHEDLAYNMLAFNRNYATSAAEIRAAEQGKNLAELTGGETLLGYKDYQQGNVALVVGTIFCLAQKYETSDYPGLSKVLYQDNASGEACAKRQRDAYYRLSEDAADKFRLVKSRADLHEVLQPWKAGEAAGKATGLLLSIEGIEWLPQIEELEAWWEDGIRLIGPVWGGGRFCGGTREHGSFTSEGYRLLEKMQEAGFGLDLAHMTEASMLQALDSFDGCVFCSHGNVRSLIKDVQGERHLTEAVIKQLGERDGVIGVVPFNHFLDATWKDGDPRERIGIQKVIDHIDAICQLTGNSDHAAFGTDFDGGIGWPSVPLELNTIGDMPIFEKKLAEQGYTQGDIDKIFHGNWERIFERILP